MIPTIILKNISMLFKITRLQSYYKKCTYASKFAKNLQKSRARLRMCEKFRTFARFIAYKF